LPIFHTTIRSQKSKPNQNQVTLLTDSTDYNKPIPLAIPAYKVVYIPLKQAGVSNSTQLDT